MSDRPTPHAFQMEESKASPPFRRSRRVAHKFLFHGRGYEQARLLDLARALTGDDRIRDATGNRVNASQVSGSAIGGYVLYHDPGYAGAESIMLRYASSRSVLPLFRVHPRRLIHDLACRCGHEHPPCRPTCNGFVRVWAAGGVRERRWRRGWRPLWRDWR
jgi:hypothetical protein